MIQHLGAMETGSVEAPEVSIPRLKQQHSNAPPVSTLRVSSEFEGDRDELQQMLDAIEDVSAFDEMPEVIDLEPAALTRKQAVLQARATGGGGIRQDERGSFNVDTSVQRLERDEMLQSYAILDGLQP